MAASRKTIDEVRKVLTRHLTDDQIERVLTDLRKIKGNSSFMDTIRLICAAGDEERRS